MDANRYRLEEVFLSVFQKIATALGKNEPVTVEVLTSKTFSRSPRIRVVFTMPPKEQVLKLLEPFKLLSPTEEARSSLDAAILHTIVNNYGGNFQVLTDATEHTQFMIDFPIKSFKSRGEGEAP